MAAFQTYPLTIEPHPEDGGYLAYFPTLPGCQSWGDAYEAAVRNAEEALAVYIETLAANKDAMRQAPLVPLNDTGRSLWGADSAHTIDAMRDEWGRLTPVETPP
jgi:predicted RNase H-like HicB family nuclease